MSLNIKNIGKYILIISGFIIYMELLLKTHIIGLAFNVSLIRIFSFSIVYAFFAAFLACFFNVKWTKRMTIIILTLLTTYYLSQDIYYQVMDEFYSFHITGDAARGFTFIYRVIQSLRIPHILYFFPLGTFIYLIKKNEKKAFNFLNISYTNPYHPFAFLAVIGLFLFIAVQTISNRPLLDGIEDPFNFSEYDLYKTMPSSYQTIDYFGALTYMRLDFTTLFSPNEDIDESEQLIRDYLLEKEEKNINAYTGLFEGKNLIYILAESFEPYAIDPTITPTIAEMMDSSLVFENYYAPHYYRNTADTEFMVHTSFFPNRNVQLNMTTYMENHFPNTFPKLFGQLDYETKAFHNYTDYFYPRNEFHTKALGFNTYYDAVKMGLMDEQGAFPGDHPWPSDLEMIQYAYDEFTQDDQFFSYLLTVSGHMSYDDSHPQAVKHLPYIESIFEVEDREPIDESLMYYLAANYELELMLSYLLERLETDNLLDDTVIIVSSDHYAYGLDDDVIEDYDTYKDLDETHLNMHKVPLFMYHPSLDRTNISNTLSSIDMLPTVSNLFNLPMNYRQAIGKDVFDPGFNTVRFQNASLLNDFYYLEIDNQYNIGKLNPYFKDEEIMLHFNRLIHEQTINRLILDLDYFNRYIVPQD